jgi:hypothetical protein
MLKRADWQALQIEVLKADASGPIQLEFGFSFLAPSISAEQEPQCGCPDDKF